MASQVVRSGTAAAPRKAAGTVAILIYLLSAAAAADLMTLFRNIPHLGVGAEANPVALYFLVNFGPWGLVGAKAGSVLFASLVAIYLARSGRSKLAKATLAIGCIATILAAFSNIWSV